jgi:formate C-acetyltransferase
MANYQEKIRALHNLKMEFNDEKLRRTGGSYDTDDHGWIPLDLADTFKPVADPSCNLVVGMEATTRTFASFLDAHPVFYHPACAFAGSWIGNVNGLSPTWRPENRQYEQEKLFPRYNIISRGLYAMNHSAPDLRIGLELGWGGCWRRSVIIRN